MLKLRVEFTGRKQNIKCMKISHFPTEMYEPSWGIKSFENGLTTLLLLSDFGIGLGTGAMWMKTEGWLH